jgi:hypothetical protein
LLRFDLKKWERLNFFSEKRTHHRYTPYSALLDRIH